MNKFMISAISVSLVIFLQGAGLIYFVKQTDELTNKLNAAESELDSRDPERKKMIIENDEIKTNYESLLKEHEAVKSDRENIIMQTEKLLKTKTSPEEIKEELEAMKKKGNAVAEELREQNKIMIEENTLLEKQNIALDGKILELVNEQAKMEEEKAEYMEEYSAANKETVVKKLNREISKLKKDNTVTISSLKKKNSVIKKSLDKTEKEREKIQKQQDKLLLEAKNLEETLDQYKGDYRDASNRIMEIEEEILNIPIKFAELARKNKILVRETSQMHYNLGVFYSDIKQYYKAVAEFEKAIEIIPEDGASYFNIGYIYAEFLNDRVKAIKYFRHYLKHADTADKDIDWVKRYILTWEAYDGRMSMN